MTSQTTTTGAASASGGERVQDAASDLMGQAGRTADAKASRTMTQAGDTLHQVADAVRGAGSDLHGERPEFANVATTVADQVDRAARYLQEHDASEDLLARAELAGRPVLITFPVSVPANFGEAEVMALLERQGYSRIHAKRDSTIEVLQDRVRVGPENRSRLTEDLEAAFRVGSGRAAVYPAEGEGAPLRFSSDLHCPDCDLHYREPVPSLFSFNSPLGACDACRGFGRTMGIDYGLVVPDADLIQCLDGAPEP